MATQTAKPKKRATGAERIFKLFRLQLAELARLEAKDNWEARTAEIQDLQRKISELEALRARESKEFLTSPKWQHAAKEKERRAIKRALRRATLKT